MQTIIMKEYLYLTLGFNTFLSGDYFLFGRAWGKPLRASFWIREFPLMNMHEHFIKKSILMSRYIALNHFHVVRPMLVGSTSGLFSSHS